MTDLHLTSTPSGGKARLVVIVLLVVAAAIFGLIYLKGPELMTKVKADLAPKMQPVAALSCTDEVTQLRAENSQLKAQLAAENQLPSNPPKMVVTMKAPSGTAAPKSNPPKTKHDQSPKDPWLNATVPDSVVKWLQHD